VWLRIEPAVAARRLRARGAARDLAKATDPAALTTAPPGSAPAGPHLPVDGADPIEEIVEEILAALTERRAG